MSHESDRGTHVRSRGRPRRPRSDGAAPGNDLRSRDRLPGRRHAGSGRLAGELRALGSRPDPELYRAADLAGGQRRDRRLQHRRGPGRPAHDGVALPRRRFGWPGPGPRPRLLPAHGHRTAEGPCDHRRGARVAGHPPGDRHPVVPVGQPRTVRQALPQFRRSRGVRKRVRPRCPQHLDAGVRRGARRHRDRPHPRCADPVRPPIRASAGADLHQLLPRDPADLAARRRLLPVALRVRHPVSALHRWRSSSSP